MFTFIRCVHVLVRLSDGLCPSVVPWEISVNPILIHLPPNLTTALALLVEPLPRVLFIAGLFSWILRR